MGDRLPEVTQKPFLGQAASFCSAGIENARKCLQGEHFVRFFYATHSLLFRSFPEVAGGVSAVVCDPNPFARFRSFFLSKYGSVVHMNEKPAGKPHTQQYSDTTQSSLRNCKSLGHLRNSKNQKFRK